MALGLYDIGCTTVYSARSDPRFSYCLYVPPGYRARAVRPELAVVIHGSPRTFMEFRDRFEDFGVSHNALILCPLFPVGVGGDGNPDGYKYLSEPGLRYDEVLLDIVAEVAARWEVPADRFGLFGFSGGAQFANRFLLLRPERLWAASLGAPGSVTLVTDEWDWWVGLRDLQDRFGATLDRDALRRVPVQTLVGAADLDADEITHREGGRYWMPGANAAGVSRPARLRALRQSLAEAGVTVTHEEVANVGHDPWPIMERAKTFLAAQLSQLRANEVR
ncbi:MAG: alpha/beta hydrolase [Alphaproteobacteria bacterium]|nr:alpha/beta hydrolase [Alphaproteobacteria bacterium]